MFNECPKCKTPKIHSYICPKCGNKEKAPRINKDISTLVKRLIDHLEILIEYSDKTFYEYKQEKYIGEVAGKLRLLVVKTGWNKPLLLELMEYFNYERSWEGKTPGMMFTLRTYMYSLVIGAQGYGFTREKLVRYVAQQSGSSHEDFTLDEELYKFIYEEKATSCKTTPYYVYSIRDIVNVVLSEGVQFLLYLHEENILNDLSVKYTYRQLLNIDTNYPHALDNDLKRRKELDLDKKLKPIKKGLEAYDFLYLTGKTHLFKTKIDGITPKEELRKNGPKSAFWMPEELKKKYQK